MRTLIRGLQMIHSRMLAWNDLPGTITDMPGSVLGGIDMKAVKPSCAACTASTPWNVFLRGSVILAQDFSQADVPHSDNNTVSVTAGADYRITDHVLVGATASYAHTDATLDDFGSSGTVDSYSPGVYASYTDGGWFANFIGRYSYNSYTENRDVAFLGQTANGGTTGNEGHGGPRRWLHLPFRCVELRTGGGRAVHAPDGERLYGAGFGREPGGAGRPVGLAAQPARRRGAL